MCTVTGELVSEIQARSEKARDILADIETGCRMQDTAELANRPSKRGV